MEQHPYCHGGSSASQRMLSFLSMFLHELFRSICVSRFKKVLSVFCHLFWFLPVRSSFCVKECFVTFELLQKLTENFLKQKQFVKNISVFLGKHFLYIISSTNIKGDLFPFLSFLVLCLSAYLSLLILLFVFFPVFMFLCLSFCLSASLSLYLSLFYGLFVLVSSGSAPVNLGTR